MTEKIIPDGYKLAAVKGLDELVYWLDRCKYKRHLENCADLIEPFEAFEYRNVSEEAVIAAHKAKAAPAVPDDVLEALRDALSVCSSVSVSRDRKIVREGCTLYAQTEEWCNWAENEVAPKIRAAIELVATTAAPSQEPAVPQGEPDFWGSGDGCWVRATDKLARPDASRFNIPLYAAPSQPVNRPQNCGTSFCSCIECVCEPEPTGMPELPEPDLLIDADLDSDAPYRACSVDLMMHTTDIHQPSQNETQSLRTSN